MFSFTHGSQIIHRASQTKMVIYDPSIYYTAQFIYWWYYIWVRCKNAFYSMSTACLLHVYCMFTACLQHVYCMFTACLLHVYCMSTACLLHVYCMLTVNTKAQIVARDTKQANVSRGDTFITIHETSSCEFDRTHIMYRMGIGEHISPHYTTEYQTLLFPNRRNELRKEFLLRYRFYCSFTLHRMVQ